MNVVLVHHGYGTPSRGPDGGGRVSSDLGKPLTEVC